MNVLVKLSSKINLKNTEILEKLLFQNQFEKS